MSIYTNNFATLLSLSLISTCAFTVSPSFANNHAADSTRLQHIVSQARKAKREKLVSYVDVDERNCIALPTPKYVIVAGNGGTNMDLRCPADHPIMREWKQRLGFGGFLWVSSGGGYATGKCCALKSKWTTDA